MKKINIILAAAVAAIGLSSCDITLDNFNDFVTVKHNSSEPLDQYINTPERAAEVLVAAYDPLRWFDYAFGGYTDLRLTSDIMADDIYCGGSNDGDQPILVKAHYYTATSIDVCSTMWTVAYSGINRCCHVLERMDAVPGLSDDLKKLYKTEAAVLKTFFYNVLWKYWGNIPYYDVNLTAPYTAPQLKADDVYERMMTAFEALDLSVLPMKAQGGQEGRVTRAMAYMLYAEIVMYQNDKSRYEKALGYMNEIIKSNQYSLVSDFAGIWEESGEWNSESIWEINYISEGANRDWGSGISLGGCIFCQLIGVPGGGGNNGEFTDGWGFGGVAAAAYAMYNEGDQRRDGGILDIEKYYTEVGSTNWADYVPRWESEGYYNRKYIARKNGNHGALGDPNTSHGNNYRVYRYAETLLNAAELAVLTGGDGSAYLKQVRDRAHCTETGTSREDIIQERRKEFVGEGKRYWDLVRTGMAETVLTAANHNYRTNSWTPSKKYWPIPQSEIDKDPGLVQNNY